MVTIGRLGSEPEVLSIEGVGALEAVEDGSDFVGFCNTTGWIKFGETLMSKLCRTFAPSSVAMIAA